MTFTSFLCPFADVIIRQVEEALRSIAGVTEFDIEITYEPQWTEEMMSEEARLETGLL